MNVAPLPEGEAEELLEEDDGYCMLPEDGLVLWADGMEPSFEGPAETFPLY